MKQLHHVNKHINGIITIIESLQMNSLNLLNKKALFLTFLEDES
jgi:hypothetical protein